MGHTMRLERTCVGLLVQLANHYTTRGALHLYISSRVEFSAVVQQPVKKKENSKFKQTLLRFKINLDFPFSL